MPRLCRSHPTSTPSKSQNGDLTEWFGAGVAAWARVLNTSTKLVGVVALLYFLYPVPDRFGRAVSLCFAVVCCYLSYMRFAYPWYFPR